MPVVSRFRCAARKKAPVPAPMAANSNGHDKNHTKTAKRRIDEPERDGRQQNRAAGLDSTIVPRGFAAPFRRGAKGQQRITSGAESRPTEPAQSVGEHGCFSERNKAEKHRSRQQQQPADEDARFRPLVSPAADERPEHHASHREASDHQDPL